MKKKIILLVGSVIGRADIFYQKNPDLIDDIVFYTILDKSTDVVNLKKAQASFQKVLLCDFSDDASILKAILPYRHDIVSIGCIGDTSVKHMAYVASFLPDVNVPSREAILWAHDKYEMRQMLAVINPNITVRSVSIGLHQYQNILPTLRDWKFPSMLKPTNLHSSILTQKINNFKELENILNAIAQNEEINKKNITFLLEEFIEGSAHSIDGVIDSYGNITFYPVVDQIIGIEAKFEEYFVYKSVVPTILTDDDVGAVHQATEQLLNSLSLRSSHFHVELKKSATGFKIIEIAPRYGFMRNILYSKGFGIDIIGNEHFVKFDVDRVYSSTKSLSYCAIYKVFPKSEGIISEYTDIDDIQSVEGIFSAGPNQHLTIDKQFIFAKNGGNPMFLKIVVQHEDLNKFTVACKFVENNVTILIK